MASIRSDISTGRRLYIQTSYGEPVVQQIKDAVGYKNMHYDRDRDEKGLWWVHPKFRGQVEELLVGQDADQAAGVKPEPEDPHKIQLVGKARYKGKMYYVRFAGETKRGHQCRLVTLDAAIDFWAPLARPHEASHDGSGDVAVMVKLYQPRERRGYGRYAKPVLEHQTLGGIRSFLARQKEPAAARGVCTECGHWGPRGEACAECGGEGHHV